MYTEAWEKLVPSHKQMQNMCSNSMAGKVMYLVLFSKAHVPYKFTQNFCKDWYSTITGIEDLTLPHPLKSG